MPLKIPCIFKHRCAISGILWHPRKFKILTSVPKSRATDLAVAPVSQIPGFREAGTPLVLSGKSALSRSRALPGVLRTRRETVWPERESPVLGPLTPPNTIETKKSLRCFSSSPLCLKATWPFPVTCAGGRRGRRVCHGAGAHPGLGAYRRTLRTSPNLSGHTQTPASEMSRELGVVAPSLFSVWSFPLGFKWPSPTKFSKNIEELKNSSFNSLGNTIPQKHTFEKIQ